MPRQQAIGLERPARPGVVHRWVRPFLLPYSSASIEVQKKAPILLKLNAVAILALFTGAVGINTVVHPNLRSALLEAALGSALLISLAFLRKGYYTLASSTTIVLLMAGMTVAGMLGYSGDRLVDFPLLALNLLPIVFAACLIGHRRRQTVVAAALCLGANVAYFLWFLGPETGERHSASPVALLLNNTIVCLVAGVVAYLVVGLTHEAIRLAQTEADRLESMVEQRTRELREAQERLVHQEKLAVLGQLAGGLAHELRNPLSTIKTSAYLLRSVVEDPAPEVRETLESLDKDVAACEAIIRSVLSFTGAKPPASRRVQIQDTVEGVLALQHLPENVKVVRELSGDLPRILADPEQIGQVLRSLIDNALQAMPSGGILRVRSEFEAPDWVVVSVTDTGAGIAQEDLGKVFEPQSTVPAKGIGLRLALSRVLVDGHGGRIEVRSDLGKGSTVRVRLPVRGDDI